LRKIAKKQQLKEEFPDTIKELFEVKVACKSDKEEENDLNLFVSFFNALMLTLGDSEAFGDLDENKVWFLKYFLFLGGTFLMTIVALNLLVSILGDTFDNAYNNRTAYDIQLKVELMRDINLLLGLCKKSKSQD